MAAWFAPKNRACAHISVRRQADSVNIILYALMLIILCVEARFCEIFDGGTGATRSCTRTDLWKRKALI